MVIGDRKLESKVGRQQVQTHSPSNFTTLRRLLGLLWPYKGWVILSLILGILTVGSGVGLLATAAWLISAAALQPSIADLSLAIVGVRFFGISRAIFRYLERLASHSVTFRLLARLRIWFYEEIEPLAPAALMRFQGGDLLTRIVSDVETLKEFYVRAIAPPGVAFVVALAMLVFMASFDVILAIGLLPFLLLAGVVLPMLVRWTSIQPGRQFINTRAALQAKLVDSLLGIADLIAFGRDYSASEQVRRLGHELAVQQRRMSWITGFYGGSSVLLAHLSMWVVLFLAVGLVSQDELDGVYLATLALATLAAFEAFQPLSSAAQHMETGLQSARRLFEIVDVSPTLVDPPQPAPKPETIELHIENLRFRYRSEGPWVLNRINLKLHQGQRIAIVGPSGAGKSTLANLLLRVWDYQEGHVLLAGRELRRYAQDDVRGLFSVVAQDSYVFNASVDENIRIARPEAAKEDVQTAARRVHLHDFIESLPLGYATRVGELGQQFSGGQRQRLVAARAMVRQAPILLLDEPTANLDAITERRVLDSIFNLTDGASLLLITHRLVGMEQMDEILVMDEGRIVERGLHEQLLGNRQLYARMWELQHRLLI
jgi:ATP-binding cassette subfamily C protein CydC